VYVLSVFERSTLHYAARNELKKNGVSEISLVVKHDNVL
jgi:hypothetical protein